MGPRAQERQRYASKRTGLQAFAEREDERAPMAAAAAARFLVVGVGEWCG